MRILVTGRGTSGSWQIRGEQLGRAMGADVIPNARNLLGYDRIVLVKRTPPDLLRRVQDSGVPFVWDIVDAWPQPEGNDWPASAAHRWLRDSLILTNAFGHVAATKQMAIDIAQHVDRPILALPHHGHPDRIRVPVREHIKFVAYEGAEHYLGEWEPIIRRECTRRGWQFVINPTDFSHVDLLLAVRDYHGYPAVHWKSNVKLANAQAAGTPIICGPESGYIETSKGCAIVCLVKDSLSSWFDYVTPASRRQVLSDELCAERITLESVAATYKSWLQSKF